MILKLNLQRFAYFPDITEVPGTSRPTTNTTSTIKIKFKDGFNLSANVDVSINFVCDGIPYQRIQVSNDLLRYQDISGDWVTCCNEIGWTNYKYKIIEVDTSQASFSTFITAMKSNIDGAELEAGTYKWLSYPDLNNSYAFPSSPYNVALNFIDNTIDGNINYTSIKFEFNTSNNFLKYIYYVNSSTTTTKYDYDYPGWYNDDLTITTTENQYVPYDFYNYAILGNQLVKQQPTPKSYTITDNLSNVSPAGSNVYQIDQGGTRSLTYSWSTQFVVGVNNINVVNADYTPTFNGNSVTLALSNPSGNVTINITASEGDFEFNITSNGTTTLATENTYVEHDIVFKVNVPSSPTETVEVALSMARGNQVITPSDGKTMTKVTIVKPSTFLPENIKKGVNIGYITGTYEGLIPDGTAVASEVRASKTFYGSGTSKLTGTMQDYTGSTTIKSNGTMYTAGKYMPSNVVIDVPNPTLSGNALASQVLKGQKFYSNSYTILTGTMETYSGDTYITGNGVVATSGKYMNSDITVDVAGITEVATSAEMDAKLKEDNVSLYYKYTGTTDDKYTNGDIYQVQDEE